MTVHPSRRGLRCILLCLTMAALICPVQKAHAAETLTPVVLQLRWDHQFQFAGYYAADWLGYYEEEGLKTEIRSAFTGGKILDAPEEVASGRAQFGVGAADILIAQDQGLDLTLVASFFQRSAVAYYTLESTPVASIYDLAGLNMARREHDLLDVELQALFLNEGIHPFNAIHADVPRDFTVEDLTSGRYELVPGYLGKIPYEAQKLGVPLRAILPIQYGIDFYGDTLFTNAVLARTDPQLVERFRRASIRGWAYALEHPEEIADRIAAMTYATGKTGQTLEQLTDFNRYQAQRVIELSHYPIVEIGNLNPHRWGTMAATLKQLGIIEKTPPLNAMIFDYQSVSLARLQKTGEMATVFFTVVIFAMALLFITYLKRRNTLLKREIAVRHETEALLKAELDENRRKEALILYQARMAAMGEMIGNIAHQWRQPLNTLRLIISNLQDLKDTDEGDADYREKAFGRAHQLIEKMSVTIDDFRFFTRPGTDPKPFDVLETLNITAELLEDQLRASDIQLIVDAAERPVLMGLDNQLSHALFNILSNAAEALKHWHPPDGAPRRIAVSIHDTVEAVTVTIEDNGPGIPLEHAGQVFDMYFSTKHHQGGTGLGLYMSKTIIENTFHGTLTLTQPPSGAGFRIRIPKDEWRIANGDESDSRA